MKVGQLSTLFSFLNWSNHCRFPQIRKIPDLMLELTSRVTRLPIEEGSAFTNLTGIPSTPV